jgi:flagellar biosynthesis protein FlhB
MAADTAAERTEDATPRKRQQAKERGNHARSRDLSAAVVLFMAVLFLRYGGIWMARQTLAMVSHLIDRSMLLPVPDGKEALLYGTSWMQYFAAIMLPMLLTLFVVALASGFMQVGFVFSSEALNLKFDRLNPVEGVKRMFSLRSFVQLLMSFGKVLVVLAVAWFSFSAEFAAMRAMVAIDETAVSIHIVQACLDLMVRLAAVLLILALLDWWYQRFQWERDLRMTRQEVKEELRDTDGDPQIKSRRRQIQRQLAQQRMMAEVPKAEVVVRNPTHFAVALGYDPQRDEVPYVVAKGTDRVALRIIRLAIDAGVPVRRQPPLARALYRLEIGESVPETLWKAVIDVLSWVYRHRKGGRADRLRQRMAS